MNAFMVVLITVKITLSKNLQRERSQTLTITNMDTDYVHTNVTGSYLKQFSVNFPR